MGSISSIVDILECPVCMTFMYPPIHQCYNGHTICSTCKGRVDNICPICRQELGDIRCLALEKVAESLDLPCRFHLFGCQDMISYHNRLVHEQICTFRPYNCPYGVDSCVFTGDISSLVVHLKEVHTFYEVDGSGFERLYLISNHNEINCNMLRLPQLYNCSGHHFYIHFKAFNIGNEPVLMAFFRFLGEESEAANFRYCLEVDGKERKLMWQGIPKSIRESVETVRDSLDGLIIPKKNLFSFDGIWRKLELIKVAAKIWRKETEARN